MNTGFKAGDRCMVVSGDEVNVGARVTLLEFNESAGGWLFDEAWPPLLIDGEEYRHSLEAPEGVVVVVAEGDLQTLAEREQQVEVAVDAILCRHGLYPVPVEA